jgi:proliferating cell nuclear antigen PCNA
MECTISDMKKVVTAVQNIGQFRQEADMVFDADGMSLTAVDDDHVMLIDFVIHKDDMDAYHCSKPPLRYHAALKSFASTMKLAVSRGPVTLSAKAEGGDTGAIAALNVSMDNSNFSIQQKPLDGRFSDLDLAPPTSAPSASLTIATKEAKRIFKEMLTFDGDVVIDIDGRKGSCVVKCAGKNGAACISLAQNVHGVVEMVTAGPNAVLTQCFDAKFLNSIVKSDVGNKTMTINVREGNPLEVRHGLGESSYLSLHLAPKKAV